jgi:FemAB-related protein (PEP-CTERM system-associated)
MHQTRTEDPIANSPHPAAAPPDDVRIHPFSPGRAAEWDAYVHAHPHGSPFHLTAWKNSIAATFGYQPLYLAAERNGALAGILPLFAVRNPLMGKALISSPFAVYGGPLADDDSVKTAFAQHLRHLGHSLGVQYVELRNAWPAQCLGFSPISRYVTFTQDLAANPDAILESIPRKTRRMVRKSLAEGFTVHTGTENPAPFEDLFSRSLRRLGTPAFPAQHYRNLLKFFAGSAEIREIRLHGRLAAAVLTFYFKNQVLPYYGASDPAFNPQAPNNFMYYDLMCSAAARGCTLFDFGRSKRSGSGSYDFKAHWGMMERELPYEMLLVRRKQLPNFSPANPAFHWPIRIWQRLPLSVTRALGPRLIRMVP